jgi:hypothetical protein
LQEDELLDLWSNQELRLDFESVKLGRFWCKFGGTCPTLTMRAYQVLVLFVTAYFCEQEFSVFFSNENQSEEQTESWT